MALNDGDQTPEGTSGPAPPSEPDSSGDSPEPRKADACAEVDSPPEEERYKPGQMIVEKYSLLRKLGEGGMGTVWVAHNESLDVDVALKLIRSNRANAEMEQRLATEARATAQIDHPAIVRVYDFGKTPTGDPFIVMELLDGEDLAALVTRRGKMTATSAVKAILPIAHALAEAHAKGIVHRDVKPENIFLARGSDGRIQPKLLDFGIAKFERKDVSRLTQGGSAMGSPLYMPPEQACGEEADERSDIWAFCVVLYEIVTGTCPFKGPNFRAQLLAVLQDSPPPITSFAAGDAALQSIIERGLQKRPDARWQSMRDLGAALAKWLVGLGENEDLTGTSLRAVWLQRSDDPRSSEFLINPAAADAEASNPQPAPSAGSAPAMDAVGWSSGSGGLSPAGGAKTPPVAEPNKARSTSTRLVAVSFAIAILVAAGAFVLHKSRAAVPIADDRLNLPSASSPHHAAGLVQSSLVGANSLPASSSGPGESARPGAVSPLTTREPDTTEPKHGAVPSASVQPKKPKDSKTPDATPVPSPPVPTTKLKSAYE